MLLKQHGHTVQWALYSYQTPGREAVAENTCTLIFVALHRPEEPFEQMASPLQRDVCAFSQCEHNALWFQNESRQLMTVKVSICLIGC